MKKNKKNYKLLKLCYINSLYNLENNKKFISAIHPFFIICASKNTNYLHCIYSQFVQSSKDIPPTYYAIYTKLFLFVLYIYYYTTILFNNQCICQIDY